MTTQAIATRNEPMPMTLGETLTLGDVLAQSGFFRDTKSAAQAVAKVLAGRELGFGPMASMTGVYVIEGRISISANLMAASVKRSQKYDYRVTRWDNEICEIEFFEGGKLLGLSAFSMKDAATASLTGKDNWKKYPRNQMFARAVSNGVRVYCPDALGGELAYTPDELGIEVTEEGDPVIDITAISRDDEPAVDMLPGSVADMNQPAEPAPARRVVAPPVSREASAQQAVWERVKAWAGDHGTDPHRFALYLSTDKGVPPKVTGGAMATWQAANPEQTYGDAYDRYVAGEGQGAADPAEPVVHESFV